MSSGSVLCLNMEQARSNTAELLRVRELEALGHLIIQHFQIRGGMILVPYPCLRCSSVVVVVVVVVVVCPSCLSKTPTKKRKCIKKETRHVI